MVDYIPMEKGNTIRFPSTANLLIDSVDRTTNIKDDAGSAGNFTISLNNSIMNGFFTRIAVSEVVLDWCVDNIAQEFSSNSITVVVDGIGALTVTIPDGQYTAAECMDAVILALNASPGLANTVFSLGTSVTGVKTLICKVSGDETDFEIGNSNLAVFLNLETNVEANNYPMKCPKLLPYTYLDFVSNSLTYNQALKDATTNTVFTNVLYRWNFAWDQETAVDAYGYPIYQGYRSFIARRALPFPKQIRWEPNQPIGQINFQVIGSDGVIVDPQKTNNGEFEWSMTCLVSEV